MIRLKELALKQIGRLSRVLKRTPLARSDTLNRWQSSLVKRLHGSSSVQVGPNIFHFPPDDHVHAKRLILRGAYEEFESEVLFNEVRPGDCVLDVGANVGLYSIPLARLVGANGTVIAVEPDPKNRSYLTRNLAENGIENVTVIPIALGDTTGTARLYQVPGHGGNSSLADLQSTGRFVDVDVRRGEDVLAEISATPRIAKIDVEGFELQVLRGLGVKPEIMLIEFAPAQLEACGTAPSDFLAQLTRWGYSYRLIEPESRKLIRMDAEELTRFVDAKGIRYNLLLDRRSITSQQGS